MYYKVQQTTIGTFLLFVIIFAPLVGYSESIIADHSSIQEFDQIPSTVIDQIALNYKIFYGHTSHGSQIMTGLDMVETENSSYDQPIFHEITDDLGHTGDVSWVTPTENWLDANPDYNMAMWSWCGGASDNNEAGINIYLAAMNQLELDYPDVTFIYMTGHLDGTGIDGNLYIRNNQIRDYCTANNKILFDFADIESYNPDGDYFPNESDICGWCTTWCASNDCPGCGSCAHSHCFNCYQKGKAFWWMMATISGWDLSLDIDNIDEKEMPQLNMLKQNEPNPFNLSTKISFDLPTASNVKLDIYDILGQKITSLVNNNIVAGQYEFNWDGLNQSNEEVASGVYFYSLKVDDFTETKKMMLLK